MNKFILAVGILVAAVCFTNAQVFANEELKSEMQKSEINNAVAMDRALDRIPAMKPFGSSYNTQNGHTIKVEKNADGSRTITETDENGKVVRQENIARGQQLPSGECFDPATGITTAIQGNADGSYTVTKKKAGKEIEKKIVKKDKRSWAESTDPDTGITTHVESNGDGTRTVTVTGPDGKVISTEVRK